MGEAEQAVAERRSMINSAPGGARDVFDALSRMPEGLLLMDREWRITYANTMGRLISRVKDEHINGASHWELYPATVGTEIERFYRRVMEQRISEELEFYYAPFEAWLKVRAFPTDSGIALQYSDTTSLHVAQEERDRAQRQMEQVLAVTQDAVFGLNREWTITFMNDAAKQMSAPMGDVLGKNNWHTHPEQVYEGSPYVEFYYRAMVQRIPGSFEAYYGGPLDGWFFLDVRPADDGIVVFVRDITQDRKDAATLRESEAKYRVLTELGPTAIWMGDAAGRITYANTRFLAYIGDKFTPGSGASDGGWLQAFYEPDRDGLLTRWRSSVQTGDDFACEARLVRARDGAVRWWHLRALPMRGSSGEITSWLGVAEEVHEQRRSKEKLQREREEVERQRQELEVIYDSAPVGLAMFEPVEFRYLRVSKRQAEIIGLPREEIIGRRFQDVATTSVVPDLFRRVVGGETVRDVEFATEFRSKPGETRSFTVNYAPVFNAAGDVRAISCAVQEITDIRRAEAALIQSEKLAAVGRLASSISHEINNPLEAVTNLLYLAAAEPGLSEAGKEYVRMAEDEVRRVSQIATQTLRFHRQQNSPTNVTPAQLVDPVLNLFQGRLVNSRIHVEASYGTVRTVLCFENDIRQILNNLIANAIDAMRNGGRLMVRAHDACDLRSGSPGVRISVADTGQGMDAATLKRVFEPFYTTKGLNGNGLGLWISQGIVERHQGQLRVRSTRQDRTHGTIFSMFLPSGTEPRPSE